MNVQHSSRTDQWGTPSHILGMARDVLGQITFDPASSWEFNDNVQAARYWTKDGLTGPWPVGETIWCNPPGGKSGNRSMAALFWNRLVNTHIRHAMFMAFSLEQMQTTQSSAKSILDFPVCVPRRRIAFIRPDGSTGPAPSHSNVIVYVPGSLDMTDKFLSVFSKLGAVKR